MNRLARQATAGSDERSRIFDEAGTSCSPIDDDFGLSADGRAILTTHGLWDVPDPASAPRG